MSARAPTVASLATLAILATACDEPLPTTAPDEGPAAMDLVAAGHTQGGDEVPLRIKGGATLEGQEFAPGFGPPTFGRSTFDGRCSAPADFLIRFTIEGQATHLGRFAAAAEHCSQIDFQTGRTSAITDGVLTYTAANGDELWSRYERGPDPAEHHQFVGGTGRFAGAVGHGTALVSCNRETGTCVFGLEGVFRYEASNRSR